MILASSDFPPSTCGQCTEEMVIGAGIDEASRILAAQAGDREAFVGLVEPHLYALRTVCTCLARDAQGAEEAAHDTCVAAWLGIATCDPQRPFLPWLIGIARNQVRDRQRRQARAPVSGVDRLALAIDQAVVETVEDPQQEVDWLRDCLGRLQPLHRRILESHYLDRQPMAEIARAQARSEGAVKMLIARIRAVLRDCIERRRDHATA